jgi:hypothetical protein
MAAHPGVQLPARWDLAGGHAAGPVRPMVFVLGVAVILVFLTFLPALALGPLAEGLH